MLKNANIGVLEDENKGIWHKFIVWYNSLQKIVIFLINVNVNILY